MRIRPLVAVALTAAAVSAVGASAYTATLGSTPATAVVAFGQTTITGATLDSDPVFHYNTDHSVIDQITVVVQTDTTASTLSLSRNAGAPVTCSDAHGSFVASNTTYVCTGLTFAVTGMTSIGYILN